MSSVRKEVLGLGTVYYELREAKIIYSNIHLSQGVDKIYIWITTYFALFACVIHIIDFQYCIAITIPAIAGCLDPLKSNAEYSWSLKNKGFYLLGARFVDIIT